MTYREFGLLRGILCRNRETPSPPAAGAGICASGGKRRRAAESGKIRVRARVFSSEKEFSEELPGDHLYADDQIPAFVDEQQHRRALARVEWVHHADRRAAGTPGPQGPQGEASADRAAASAKGRRHGRGGSEGRRACGLRRASAGKIRIRAIGSSGAQAGFMGGLFCILFDILSRAPRAAPVMNFPRGRCNRRRGTASGDSGSGQFHTSGWGFRCENGKGGMAMRTSSRRSAERAQNRGGFSSARVSHVSDPDIARLYRHRAVLNHVLPGISIGSRADPERAAVRVFDEGDNPFGVRSPIASIGLSLCSTICRSPVTDDVLFSTVLAACSAA